MQRFIKEAIGLFIILFISTLGILNLGVKASKRGETLFPTQDGGTPWVVAQEPAENSEDESLVIQQDVAQIEYDFVMSSQEQYSYTAYILDFLSANPQGKPVDFSQYRGVSFRIRCQPKNVLLFAVLSIDEDRTIPSDTSTHRVSSTFFTCENQWREVTIDFSEVVTPDWWLEKFDYLLTSDRYLKRDRVSEFRFVNSLQSPRGESSKVAIAELKLIGENRHYIHLALLIIALLWLFYIIRIGPQYIRALVLQGRERVRLDLPIVAYQKLSVAPHKDKEKDAILRLMATQYSDAEFNIENAINKTGLNRHKINHVLKSELGLTFSSYLNKLRLIEAARLLAEQEKMNISEIAYAVGYNNVSYFTRLFKSEYGCSPKTFRSTQHN